MTSLEPCKTCGSDAIATRSDCFDGDEFCLVCDPPEDDEFMYSPLSPAAAAILGVTFDPAVLVAHLELLQNEAWKAGPNLTPWKDQVMSPPRKDRS